MKMPQGEEADPLFVYSTRPIDNGPGVMLGDLKIEPRFDHRVKISFIAIAPDSLDLSEGFLRDLSILLLHRSRGPAEGTRRVWNDQGTDFVDLPDPILKGFVG